MTFLCSLIKCGNTTSQMQERCLVSMPYSEDHWIPVKIIIAFSMLSLWTSKIVAKQNCDNKIVVKSRSCRITEHPYVFRQNCDNKIVVN